MQIASHATRQLSSDLALKILNSGSEDASPSLGTISSSQSSKDSPIAVGTSKSQANVAASWMNNLAAEIGLPSGFKQVWTQPARLDVTSDSFKDYLRGVQETANGWPAFTGEIVDALDAGTLTIESPETNPWDITFYHEDGREAGGAMKYDDEVWVDFLDDHLARDEQGNYLHSASGAFIDKATGQSADMGQIGGNCYYMTWPTPK